MISRKEDENSETSRNILYPFFDNAELNTLEMKFLELIQYNTHIKFSLYTKYYLELKGLVPNLPLKQMNVFDMAKLERQSKKMEDFLIQRSFIIFLQSRMNLQQFFR